MVLHLLVSRLIKLVFLTLLPLSALAQEVRQTEEKSSVSSLYASGIAVIAPPTRGIPVPLMAQISIGYESGLNRFAHRVYIKSGLMPVFFYCSLFLESAIQWRKVNLPKDRNIHLEIPIWLGCRKYREFFLEGQTTSSNYTTIQLGTGMNLVYVFSPNWSVNSSMGIGLGPLYSNAATFRFEDFSYKGLRALPNLDLGLKYRFR